MPTRASPDKIQTMLMRQVQLEPLAKLFSTFFQFLRRFSSDRVMLPEAETASAAIL